MYDFHIHTKFSFDCSTEPRDYILLAIKKGMKEICFTDHTDLMHPWPLPSLSPDMKAYRKEIFALKEEFPEIKIRFGIEAGLMQKNLKATLDIIKNEDFDYIIASQHTAGGSDPDFDKTLFDKYGIKGYMRLYLKELKQNIEDFDFFDAVGHIGYAARYINTPSPITYEDFKDDIDGILDVILEKDKALEINSSGLYTVRSTMPHMSIVKRYLEKGGEKLTFGSDAHFECVLGNAYEQTISQIKQMGAKYIYTFEKRKPIPHEI